MKRSFKPTLENLESRQMMDAAGMHAICENLAVAPMARTCEIAVVADNANVPFVGGWGASSYQYAFEGTSGIALHDDVVIDGRIITGENYDSANSPPVDDNGHGTHVAGTIGAVGNNAVAPIPTDQFSVNFSKITFNAHGGDGGAGKVQWSDISIAPTAAPSDLVVVDETRIAAADYLLRLDGVEGESTANTPIPGHEFGHTLGIHHTPLSADSRLDGLFDQSDETETAGICHGVSVLAWARVDGVSPG